MFLAIIFLNDLLVTVDNNDCSLKDFIEIKLKGRHSNWFNQNVNSVVKIYLNFPHFQVIQFSDKYDLVYKNKYFFK